MNSNNFAKETGRLTKAPIIIENKNGNGATVLLRLAVKDNYNSTVNGERVKRTNYVTARQYVTSESSRKHFAEMRQGDEVETFGPLVVYNGEIQVNAEEAKLTEPKFIRDERAKRRENGEAEPTTQENDDAFTTDSVSTNRAEITEDDLPF